MQKPAFTFLAFLLFACSASRQTGTNLATTIAGSHWQLESIKGFTGALPSKPITLNFNDSTKLNGFGGCNRYFATFELQGDSIEISAIGATRMYCKETSKVEASYFKALQGKNSIEIQEGNQLFIGEALIFVPDSGEKNR